MARGSRPDRAKSKALKEFGTLKSMTLTIFIDPDSFVL
jgi:hypothetical protein